MERIRVRSPVPGTCRICAAVHDPKQPHDKDSLYYQNWFFKKYKRLPTLEDAMQHCSEEIKEEMRKKGM